MKTVKVTHRWGGPILITKKFLPIFRRHSKNKNVMVLGGYSGHGVALSVYLGRRAAESMISGTALPNWR
jgi:glycine/D-amino acid oxidase-like deaminating enzyme